MSDTVTPFLMFTGRAEEAMTFYTSLLPDSRITSLEHRGPDEEAPEGTVRVATFTLGGRPFMCIDSPPVHDFDFTPSMSLFVTCRDEAEVGRLYEALVADGAVMMPLQAYPFAAKFAWISDRFGVSWQLSLPHT